MTRTRTRLDYSGRFSRINDTVSVKKVDPFFRQFYNRYWEKARKKTIDRNSDKAISKDKLSFNHQPNRN